MSTHIPNNHKQCSICSKPFFTEESVIDVVALPDGRVIAEIITTDKTQGYQGIVQGGIISTLHDCMMVHCLFYQEIVAYTAELSVRFISPVPLGQKLMLEAMLTTTKKGIYYLQSTITCDGKVLSKASGKFV
ncbi:hypothetical protein BCU70_01135 [Vibrio sp. 10N.286.49.C2]|uniref:PaaI family thioesterase n=1 Tax=unclassified Vibrio TaxID=2614977 RepID=UPI000C85B11B|nr:MULTISPECIES: PaaI family thioesterase [unclassified Vibrio]PMH42798.1 hypothetical protein BCU70_01135 [Vibrio sp. 10N.286.49.C2]PMH53864.1 hypothetical protein BCU66_13700 [Vibrio sp. 10N.286.49.B1]PMH81640.1 hypothetical protein BCU58_20845 [Vibrio sp. 10N.286.48.B7]